MKKSLRTDGLSQANSVRSGDPFLAQRFCCKQWLREVKEFGVSESDLANSLERIKDDQMDTLSDQLQWMQNSGFAQVNVWFQDYSFNVYSGMKMH